MTIKPLNLLIFVQDTRQHVLDASFELIEFLKQQAELNFAVVDHNTTITDQHGNFDLGIVLGGDGAILRSCRQLHMNQIPFVGINLGRLGFLADLDSKEFMQFLPKFRAGGYKVVEHLMFSCKLHKPLEQEEFIGLNEVKVCSGPQLGMVDVQLSINGEYVTTYSGDGLLVSTPVGSTAHNLSAGGPILRQSMQAFVVTPICPHTLSVRPIVDDAESLFRLDVPPQHGPHQMLQLVIDGQVTRQLFPGDYLEVQKAPVSFKIARLPKQTFYHTLHRKLGWGGQPRYRQSK